MPTNGGSCSGTFQTISDLAVVIATDFAVNRYLTSVGVQLLLLLLLFLRRGQHANASFPGQAVRYSSPSPCGLGCT